MLVNEVVNSKSIALNVSKNPSNDIPYLGEKWFPNQKMEGLDLKWVKTSTGLPVALQPSNFDALPVLRSREALDIQKTQMAFFREEMDINEEHLIELDRIKSTDDAFLEMALNAIYNDTDRLVLGAEVIPEVMRMQLLATTSGSPQITFSANGVNYSYNYDTNSAYASSANHYVALSGTSQWTVANKTTATPLSDLQNASKKLKELGKAPKYALMNSATFNKIAGNAQIASAILAQNATATVFITDDMVKKVIESVTGLKVVIYDKMYKDYTGASQYFYPTDRVTILPDEKLGNTWFGTTPEERTGRQIPDTDVTMHGGIAIATKVVYGPPFKMQTIASLICLPSYENMDSTFVIKTA